MALTFAPLQNGINVLINPIQSFTGLAQGIVRSSNGSQYLQNGATTPVIQTKTNTPSVQGISDPFRGVSLALNKLRDTIIGPGTNTQPKQLSREQLLSSPTTKAVSEANRAQYIGDLTADTILKGLDVFLNRQTPDPAKKIEGGGILPTHIDYASIIPPPNGPRVTPAREFPEVIYENTDKSRQSVSDVFVQQGNGIPFGLILLAIIILIIALKKRG